MNQTLKTPLVFMDTEAFDKVKLKFTSFSFGLLRELHEVNRITIYLTDITLKEVEAHISEKVDQIYESIKKLKDNLSLLENFDEYSQIFNFDKDLCLALYHRALSHFLRGGYLGNDIPIISVSEYASITSVFNKYFSQQPPFNNGKKKYEFPDAFVIEALEQWCKKNNKLMYIISRDSDMKKACLSSNYLLSIETVDEFLNLVHSEEKYIFSIAHQWFLKKNKEIKEKIIECFSQQESHLKQHNQIDTEIDIDNIKINSISLGNGNLIEIKDELVVFAVEAEISYSTDVIYVPDLLYTQKDGSICVFNYLEETLDEKQRVLAYITIEFSRNEPHEPKIIDTKLSIEKNFSIKETYSMFKSKK